jgi:hypothetical protein
MRRTSNPTRSAAPTTDPTTIPAISPPVNPFFEVEALGLAVAEADDVDVDDDVGADVEKVMKAVMVGKTTPAHLSSAFEL